MPIHWSEQYPTKPWPIEYQHLNALRDNKKLYLYTHLYLERSRQLEFSSENHKESESIYRDYVLVRSPGYTSWQQKEAQASPQLEIFHSDKIRVPKSSPHIGYKNGNSTDTSILNRWYLQDVSRSSVEKLLQRHFGISIPLDAESTANHWYPAVIFYNVEVELDIWETRLAMFFDGNIGTSKLPLASRIHAYKQRVSTKRLGEKYLELWRSKWQSVENEPAVHHSRNLEFASPHKAPKAVSETTPETGAGGRLTDIRGRKRRILLRQIRNNSGPLLMVCYRALSASRSLISLRIALKPA